MPYIVKVDDREFQVEVERESRGFKILVDGKPTRAEVIEGSSPSHLSLVVGNKPYDIVVEDENTISVNGESFRVRVEDERMQGVMRLKREVEHREEVAVQVPMPGLVIKIEVAEGDRVKAGQGVVIVEAMKMQNEMKAPRDGIVKRIAVKKGMTVNGGDTLVVIE